MNSPFGQPTNRGAAPQQRSGNQQGFGSPQGFGAWGANNQGAQQGRAFSRPTGGMDMSGWGVPKPQTQDFGAFSQPTYNFSSQQSQAGNWANSPQGRPAPFQANYYDLQGRPTSFEQQQAQRGAMVEQMRKSELPYNFANAFNQNIGPPQYDFNSMLDTANKAVDNGYYNPFQSQFQAPASQQSSLQELFDRNSIKTPPGFLDQILGVLGQQAPQSQLVPQRGGPVEFITDYGFSHPDVGRYDDLRRFSNYGPQPGMNLLGPQAPWPQSQGGGQNLGRADSMGRKETFRPKGMPEGWVDPAAERRAAFENRIAQDSLRMQDEDRRRAAQESAQTQATPAGAAQPIPAQSTGTPYGQGNTGRDSRYRLQWKTDGSQLPISFHQQPHEEMVRKWQSGAPLGDPGAEARRRDGEAPPAEAEWNANRQSGPVRGLVADFLQRAQMPRRAQTRRDRGDNTAVGMEQATREVFDAAYRSGDYSEDQLAELRREMEKANILARAAGPVAGGARTAEWIDAVMAGKMSLDEYNNQIRMDNPAGAPARFGLHLTHPYQDNDRRFSQKS